MTSEEKTIKSQLGLYSPQHTHLETPNYTELRIKSITVISYSVAALYTVRIIALGVNVIVEVIK